MPEQIPFDDLQGSGDLRLVNGVLMDRVQYETEGWILLGIYTVEHPHRLGCPLKTRKVQVWAASKEGLVDYGQGRRGSRRSERESKEFQDYVDSLEDSKPPYRGGRE